MTTIIERDVSFYESEVERLRENVRRCAPQHESFWRVQQLLAEHVVRALREYAGEVAPHAAHALRVGPTSGLLDPAPAKRDECTCAIGWVDSYGRQTHDHNPAIGRVRCRAHNIRGGMGRSVRIETSQWFPICAEHARRLPDPGMHDWEADFFYGDEDAAYFMNDLDTLQAAVAARGAKANG